MLRTVHRVYKVHIYMPIINYVGRKNYRLLKRNRLRSSIYRLSVPPLLFRVLQITSGVMCEAKMHCASCKNSRGGCLTFTSNSGMSSDAECAPRDSGRPPFTVSYTKPLRCDGTCDNGPLGLRPYSNQLQALYIAKNE